MTWDFSTDPDFGRKLDWIEHLVREELHPLEPLLPELSADEIARLLDALEQQVRDQGLWAAHLAPLVDGANEVHQVTVAKQELKRYAGVEGWPSEHIPTRLDAARARFAHLLEAGA